MFHNVCCRNKCGNVLCIFNFIFFNQICEKTRNNTLLIFLYVLVNPRTFFDKIKKKIKIYTPDEIQGQSKG